MRKTAAIFRLKLKSLTIGVRMLLLFGTAVLAVTAIGFFALDEMHRNLVEERKAQVRHMVEATHALIAHYGRLSAKGALETGSAQQMALDAVRSMRYNGNGYIWINDKVPRMLMHPIQPELEGQNLSRIRDGDGKTLFVEFVRVVENDGGGYVDYLWKRTIGQDAVRKISYVMGYEPWGWIVGSGVYVDDIDSAFRKRAFGLLTFALVFLLPLAFIGWRINSSILRQLEVIAGTLNHMHEAAYLVDRSLRFSYVNDEACRMLGYRREELLTMTMFDIDPDITNEKRNELWQHIGTGTGSLIIETEHLTKDEKVFPVELSASLIRIGNDSFCLALARDITERKAAEKQLYASAFVDSLTGLPNRALFNSRLQQAVVDAEQHGQGVGLMMLDLDGFKGINDTLGHIGGDKVLIETGKRLRNCARRGDTVARLGGDEFAIVLPDIQQDGNIGGVAEKILAAITPPFCVDGKEFFVSASIGVAIYPRDTEKIEKLLQFADSALYHAKDQGRNTYAFHSAELTARSRQRLALENALRHAEKRGEMELYFQPQVDLIEERLIGAEALIRWKHPEHGLLTPDKFIEIAEKTGLIVSLGEWIIATACRTVTDWNTRHGSNLRVAVNLSARQFKANDLPSAVRQILMATGCRPEWIEFEVTESLLLEDSPSTRAMMQELHDIGITLALDDFGTGYSALGYLNRMPFHSLKIDRSFIQDVPEDQNSTELVRAIFSMATSLRLQIVAEGVETHTQEAFLRECGCRWVQGYRYGKPMPRHDFESLIATSGDGPDSAFQEAMGTRDATGTAVGGYRQIPMMQI